MAVLQASDLAFLFSIGSQGSGDGQLSEPRGVCASGELLFVVDNGNRRVVVFHAADGVFVRSITLPGAPHGVCVSASGEWLCVSDLDLDCVRVLRASDGSLMRSIGSSGSGEAQFSYPRGVCLSPDDELLFVADRFNHRVQVLVFSFLSHPLFCSCFHIL